MQRLSGLDASFLYFETPTMHMHVCATIVVDPSTMPGGYSFETLKGHIAGRLHLVPPFRRRLAHVPFNLAHPVWVEDAHFDLDYHVRRIGCPAPGSEDQLAELAGDVASRPLDRTKPLWEMWVVEGLENGYIAIVAKMHHATIDGVSGANMLVHLLDLEPNPAPRPEPDEWTPERKPSDVELVGKALVHRLTKPVAGVRVAAQTIGSVVKFVRTRMSLTRPGMATPLTAPRTSFNTTITPHRKVAYARISLDDVKMVKNAFGTTVNDVVLAVTAGALRRYLEENKELPDKSLLAVVPVSVRPDDGDKSTSANRVSAMFSSLATDIEDPVERLMHIHEANKGAKEEHKAIGADMLQNWAEFAAPTTFSLAARLYSSMRLAERHPVIHNLVISNVPGPNLPLYFGGAKLVALYPLGPIFDGAALNITVLSYMDAMNWGFISCRETVPGLWNLAAAVGDSIAELRKAAEAANRTITLPETTSVEP
ncbi:MAG: wax ester/triacylglycerol synthase family O-acyltransferase [Actinomycetota bacterium]|nr:wax ester/triacylglycerol synthase family O-acyltransferase [Actinomycetota bacterium]